MQVSPQTLVRELHPLERRAQHILGDYEPAFR